MALRPVEDRTTKTQSIFRRSFALSPKIQLPASTQKNTFQIAPVSNPLKLTDEYTRLPLIAQARPIANKMTDALAVKIVLRVAKGKPCKSNTFSKALEHLRNGSVSSVHAKKVVPYLIKWFKNPFFYSMVMNTFTSLAGYNKPKLGSTLTNKGAKAMRAVFKNGDESLRKSAVYHYAFLLDVANLSTAEARAAGPILRDRIANDPEHAVRSEAVNTYGKLYDSRWVKKTTTQEAAAGARCLRKAGVKYKKLYVPLAYGKLAIRLNRKSVNSEARALYKLGTKKNMAIRVLGIDLFSIIARYHASKISSKTSRKWEKLLLSALKLPPIHPLTPSARRSLRPQAVTAYSYAISKYKGTKLDKAVLKLINYIGDKRDEVRTNVVVSLKRLFTKCGSTTKHRIAKAIRSRFTDSDSGTRRYSIWFYGNLIYKHVNRSELLSAKRDLQKALKDKHPLVRKNAQITLAAINQRLRP